MRTFRYKPRERQSGTGRPAGLTRGLERNLDRSRGRLGPRARPRETGLCVDMSRERTPRVSRSHTRVSIAHMHARGHAHASRGHTRAHTRARVTRIRVYIHTRAGVLFTVSLPRVTQQPRQTATCVHIVCVRVCSQQPWVTGTRTDIRKLPIDTAASMVGSRPGESLWRLATEG